MKRMTGVVLGALLVVAACGSSGGTKALSKDDFVTQGNSICQKGNDAINSAGSQQFSNASQQPDAATMQKFFKDTVLPNIKTQLDDLDKLSPPKELQAQVDKLITDARAALTKLQEQVDKDPANAGNPDPFADVNKEATALGLTVCAANGAESSSS